MDLKAYNVSNEKRRLKKFIVDKLSFIAFENFNKKNNTILEKNLKFLTTNEVNYILGLGFLKSDDYTTVKENSKYEFINEIIQKYFLSKYIKKEQNLTQFREYIEIIKKNREIDVFAFLNISLKNNSKEYTILIKKFTELINEIDDKELEIKLLARTQIKIDNLKNKIEKYNNFIENVEENIIKSILKLKIQKIKL